MAAEYGRFDPFTHWMLLIAIAGAHLYGFCNTFVCACANSSRPFGNDLRARFGKARRRSLEKAAMPSEHDADIEAMNLTVTEKEGLQVFRNYSKLFEEQRAKRFAAETASAPALLAQLSDVLRLIVQEEPRALPVIACAYADDAFKTMYQREIAVDVPGGRSSLLSGFGPLARLSQRIQMAFAFEWLSKDMLIELDHLRRLRNDLAHKWDKALLEKRTKDLIDQLQFPLEKSLGDGTRLPSGFDEDLEPTQRLRIRLIWILGRLTYETHVWVKALKAGLPASVLYGPHAPAMLSEVAGICVDFTRRGILLLDGGVVP